MGSVDFFRGSELKQEGDGSNLGDLWFGKYQDEWPSLFRNSQSVAGCNKSMLRDKEKV